ncbi:hypothetical protein B0H13DRAFT_2084296, partial [Mycena leptocephala]
VDPHDNRHLRLICPMCRKFPEHMTVTLCGHVFCQTCISDLIKCPVCTEQISAQNLSKVYPSFSV